jgi:hypothetical protein
MARPYLAAVGLVFVAHSYAWAQTPAPTQDIARSPEPGTPPYLKKFEGSSADLSTYIGSGSFYTSGYRNPYASLALFLRPSYKLGTPYKLALRARIYVEQELTTPDTPNGRRFYPYDPWFWLAADNLKTFERSKVRIGGTLRTILPLSYESLYSHMLFAVGGGPSVNREFTFGQVNDEARKWTLKVMWLSVFMKYVHSSDFRGDGPGDTTGCLAPSGGGAPYSSGAPTGAEADRCGGPANTNFAFGNTFMASLARGKWSGMISLYLSNSFKYAFPADAMTSDNAALTGRSDMTWGIIGLTRELRPHLSVTAGISSLQPALDSRYRYPRFPFWDFSGANANNFSQIFFSLSGAL